MSLRDELLDLDEAVSQVSRNANAIAAMSRGLDQVDDPYADGFYAVSDQLTEAVKTLRNQMDVCLKTV